MGLNLLHSRASHAFFDVCACVCTCAHSRPCRGQRGMWGAFLGSSLPFSLSETGTLTELELSDLCWPVKSGGPPASAFQHWHYRFFCTIWLFTWIRGDQKVGPEVCVLSSWASPVNAHSDKCFIYCFESSWVRNGGGQLESQYLGDRDRWIFSLRPDRFT